MADVMPQQKPIRSLIPARLDRLGRSSFHTRMVCGLGAAWILDGLQITIASSVTGVPASPETLGMTATEIRLIASVYLVGAAIMMIGGVVELLIGINAEGKSLEAVTKPLTTAAA